MDSRVVEILGSLIVLIIAVLEIRRGWKILVRKQVAFITGGLLLLKVLRFFEFDELSGKIEQNMSNEDSQRISGIIGIVIGPLLIFSTIGSLLGFLH
jgi:hypothetical protein